MITRYVIVNLAEIEAADARIAELEIRCENAESGATLHASMCNVNEMQDHIEELEKRVASLNERIAELEEMNDNQAEIIQSVQSSVCHPG